MDNHYHLLIETPDGNLSIGMRQLNGVYTQAFNKRHRRIGHLFQRRYKAILIQKDSQSPRSQPVYRLKPCPRPNGRAAKKLEVVQLSGYGRKRKTSLLPYYGLATRTIQRK